MKFTRRTLLQGAIGAAGVTAVGGLSAGPAAATTPSGGVATTLRRTFLRGAPGVGGFAPLALGGGEPYLLRRDLAQATIRRRGGRRVVASFAQLTDIHVMDVQSPARFEFFDAYGSLPFPGLSDFTSACRPQELLSAQVGRRWCSSCAPCAEARRRATRSSSRWSPATTPTTASTTSCAGISTCSMAPRCGRTQAITRATKASWTTCRRIPTTGIRPPASARRRRSSGSRRSPACLTRHDGSSVPPGSACRGTRPTGTTTGWCRATCPGRHCSRSSPPVLSSSPAFRPRSWRRT
jgi:hypothetical protein